MAQRRMFSLEIVDTDAFLDMPASAQNLYFHLGMRADDDGFVSSPRRIATTVNSSPDDLKLLAAKRFIIPFSSGVCVIRSWKTNNYIQKDRYHETRYLEEKKQISEGENGDYFLLDTTCIQDASRMDTEVREELEIGKSRARDRGVKDTTEGCRGTAPSDMPEPYRPPSDEDFERMRNERLSLMDSFIK